MIKSRNQFFQEVVPGVRDGKGSLLRTKLLDVVELQGKGRLFAQMVLKAGCSIGLHQHNGEIDVYYILSGKGQVDDNGSIAIVQSGDVVFTGNGESHAIENIGNEDLVFIALVLFANP